jgi:hypothetical protein
MGGSADGSSSARWWRRAGGSSSVLWRRAGGSSLARWRRAASHRHGGGGRHLVATVEAAVSSRDWGKGRPQAALEGTGWWVTIGKDGPNLLDLNCFTVNWIKGNHVLISFRF